MNGSTDADSDTVVTRLWRLVLRIAIPAAAIVWFGGTLLWVTVQDAVRILSGIFYALPLPLLIVAGAIVCAVCLRRSYDCRITAMCLVLLELHDDTAEPAVIAAALRDGLAACDFPPTADGVAPARAAATLRAAGLEV